MPALGPLTVEEEASVRALVEWPGPKWSDVNSTVLLGYMRQMLATLDRERATSNLHAAHDLVPFPPRGKFAEVRMIYCQRCGASQPVESAAREALPPCRAAIASPVATDAAIEAEHPAR